MKERIQLVHGDCVDVLKTLEAGSVDIVLTDIPYGIDYSDWDVFHQNKNRALGGSSLHQQEETSFKRRGKPINGWSQADKQIPLEYQNWCESWANELYRVTKEGSPVLIFSSRRFQHRVCQALENQGFMIRDILIWEKDKCNAKAQRIEHVLKKRGIEDSDFQHYRLGNLAPYYEPIIFAMKPYKKTLTDCVLEHKIGGFYHPEGKIPSNIFFCPINKRNIYHETEKPVPLLETLIRTFSIDENHVVLDFCMGSASTGIACLNLNRKFLGIEKSTHYYEVAKQRIENHLKSMG